MANDLHDHLNSADPGRLIRERELAKRWAISPRTLQRWRGKNSGPAYILIGGTVRYRMADVLVFEQEMRRGGAQ
ncbi:DNA-binding protein [Arsenicitalea aurantiaca]|uniref:DNA-binding protein n=1 Tax=Arsenicitalea aurantiaca TaxID=1783274 RepID=A0A433XEQ5_9HYPH|nr:helix-turn-helix domain-containing protein [Arsenicitalea aurantiaca]RUT32428.1 DNA-binding protein [Arsenicitalea aurantiaca]